VQRRFDAIILAGYDPNQPHALLDDRSAPHKALLPLAGRPMAGYVIEALAASRTVDHIVVAGLEPSELVDPVLDPALDAAGCTLHFLPNRPSLFANAIQGFELLASWQDGRRHALLTSADVPLLTGGMVTAFLRGCQPFAYDAYWGIVERRVMEATFPGSRRTYLRLVEGQFCNGELYLGRIEAALRQQTLLQEMIELRKHVVRQVRRLGLGLLLRLVLRRLTVAELVDVAWRSLRLTAAPVILPFAESGMDVDKPHQLAQVEAYLRRRSDRKGPGQG
jgi:CTP:molybdopterin cytidylyltransferase MocA